MSRRTIHFALLCLAGLLCFATAHAQQAAPPDAGAERTESATPWPTLDLARAYLAQVESRENLEQPAKTELIGQYQAAIADLEATATARAQATAFDDDRIAAPQRLTELRQELAAIAATSVEIDLTGDLGELENRLSNVRQEFDSWRTRRDTHTSEASRRADRLAALPSLIASKRDELRSLNAGGAGPSAEADAAAPELARQVATAAKRQRLEAEVRLLEAEQASYTARAELLTARRERADRMVSQLTRQLEALQAKVTQVRTAQAESQAQESRTQAEELPRALADAATENAALAEELARVQRRIGDVAQARTESQSRLSDIRSRLEKFNEPDGDIELDRWFGVRLRAELARLPDARQLRLVLREIRSDISSIRRRQFELSDALLSVSGDLESRAQELIDAAPVRNNRIEAAAEEIVRRQLDTLRALDAAHNELLAATLEHAAAIEQTTVEVEQFQRFIERRILWVRSDEPISARSLSLAYRGLIDAVDPSQWAELPAAAGAELRSRFLRHAGSLVLALALLIAAPRLRDKLRRLNQAPASAVRQRMIRTLLALVLLMASAAAIPAVLLVVAQFLFAIDVGWVHAEAFGASLVAMAILLFVVRLLLGLCRSGGVGERDFRWPAEARRRVVRSIRAWAPFAIIAIAGRYFFLTAATMPGAGEASRLFVIFWLLLLTWLAWRLSLRSTPLMRALWGADKNSWLYRLWPMISTSCVVGPVALAIAAGFGYTYTATELSQRISASILAVIALVLARAILRRWLILQRRQLAVEQLRAEQNKATEGVQAPSDVPLIRADSDSIDIAIIGEQTNKLVRVGAVVALGVAMLLIWANLLPALGILQDIRLEAVGLTLGDMLAALFVVFLTYIIARNAPGLMEITVLRRLPLDAGGRYAASSLLRYTIVLIGVIAAGAAVGLKWSSVQWLAAAATVGLGFGLQEIFANFVSGLIILFERPLRVGDTVTVGSLTGTVTKIRIRATTILDWDRKEIIIPNKEFITTQLINWTLTDSILRVTMTVGVAYGSDTELVEQLLYKVAKDNPIILDDPKPQVLFKEFGDSSLNFELRLFLPTIENFVSIRHSVNRAIDATFRAHDVEIAFPQRDLHIRTVPAALAQSIAASAPKAPSEPSA